MKMTGFTSPDGAKAWFFVGGSYVRYDVEGDRVDDGYPLRIADHWPGLFESDIDACVPWNDGTVLFFKGDQYAKYDWEADTVADGFPRAISDDWPELFASSIDAGVLLPSGNAYFFQGDSYLKWDTATSAVDGGVTLISDGWPGLFDSGVEAAVLWPSGDLYFFRAGEYSRYDLETDAVAEGYPRPVAGNWPGLPFEDGGGPPVVPTGDDRPARSLTVDEAWAELDRLQAEGLVKHARSAMPGKVDLDGMVPFTDEKQDGNVAGVVVRYLPSGSKHVGAPASPNAPDRLDPRNALAIVRLCRWLHETYGVTEMYHLGIDGDASGQRIDCHGQGRAIDFVGVAGSIGGTDFVLTVNDDWGTVDTPSTPGGIWQPVGTSATHFRLDDAAGRDFERDFFRSLYEFIAGQFQDHSNRPDGPAAASAIGAGTFIMHPDHPTSKPGTKNGREAHQNHIHMQIGVTGTA
jgi:hypothetical protein